MLLGISLLLLGFGIFDIFYENKNKSKILIILMVVIWILLSTRGFLGTDWYFYYPSFMSNTYIYEKGYMLYSFLIGSIYKNYTFFQSITLGIDFICLYFIFKKYCKYYILAFVIFFSIQGLFMEVELLRNMKAIILFIFSLKYIEERKFIPYIILNLIGVSFHQSAILYIPLYYLLNINFNKKLIISLFLLGSLIYLSNFDFILNSLDSFGNYLNGSIGEKIDNYLKVIPKNIPRGLNLFYIERVILFLIAYYYEKNKILKNIGYLSVFIFLYTSELSIISLRIGILFIFITWFLYARAFEYINKKVILSFLIGTICIFRIYINFSYPGNKINYKYENSFIYKLNYKKREKELIESKKYMKSFYGKELLLQY